jgi:ComF family protein
LLCGRCRDDLKTAGPVEVPGLERVAAVWTHEGAARELVLGLKLRGMRTFAEPLVGGLVDLVMRMGTEAGVVTWPPCSRTDKRRRGFDHAELLARGLATRIGLPAEPLLRRVGRAADQAGLSGEERRRNLLGAFEARTTPEAVLLVDDVVTTGATLHACAGALRSVGTAVVEAVAACSAFGGPPRTAH